MSYSPQYLSGSEIRQKFLHFYGQRQHKILPSASLVPEDPTLLLTIAGMVPFKPIFLGLSSSEWKRATTAQKCIRTNDIENVGRTARHHTFFEMLGNFSFGDYFKEEAIAWAWELSTEVFGLPPARLVVSVYEEDEEALGIWRDKIGVSPHRIVRMGEKDNFWKSGPTGPCGPCSEIYYDFHPELGEEGIDLEDDRRFIEFYNLVFMQYNRDGSGNLTPLAAQNIDTGMGLERMAQILQSVPNNYETDLIFPILKTAAELAAINYSKADEKTKVSLKVIGDHVRATVHMIGDGITAANIGRGYILRRLIRRVVRHSRQIGIQENFIQILAQKAISMDPGAFPNLKTREEVILQELEREVASFTTTLARGEKLLAEILASFPQQISGVDAFTLYDTYGFPLELTQEIAAEAGLKVDVESFEAEMARQRIRSQAAHETIDLTFGSSIDELAKQIPPTEFLGYRETEATATVKAVLGTGKKVQIVLDRTPFYAESGGQIGDRGSLRAHNLLVTIEDVQKEAGLFLHSGSIQQGMLQVGDTVTATIDISSRRRAQAHHTATHLLQASLKKHVMATISQAGSLVAGDRLRFDFNCPRPLEQEELQQIEAEINTWIREARATETEVMSLTEAKEKGATYMAQESYGYKVRVVDIPGVSMELCGGTHVGNTAEIGLFKIISEIGISAGVRRIEAVAGPAVLEYLNLRDKVVRELSDRLKVKPEGIPERVNSLQGELKASQKQLAALKEELALAKSDQLLQQVESVGEFKILVGELENAEPEALKAAAVRLQQKLGESAVVLGSTPAPGKVSLVAAFSTKVNKEKKLQAGKFIGQIAKICGGGGGGRPNLAQAGGREPGKLTEALATARKDLLSALK